MAEGAFWNAIVNLCIDDRVRRNKDNRRLEVMYRTGTDPDAEVESEDGTLSQNSGSSKNDLRAYIGGFTDGELKDYLSFSSDNCDQRLELEHMGYAAFWNAIVNLCVDERDCRKKNKALEDARLLDEETSRLEDAYRMPSKHEGEILPPDL